MMDLSINWLLIVLIFAKLVVFSQEDRRIMQGNRRRMRRIRRLLDRMIELWEHLHQVDIIDGFVNELVINCVGFCITDCVFTGGGGESWA